MERKIRKTYKKGDLEIIWQPHLCIHSGICFKGLGKVFDPKRRPWVDPEQASSSEIMKQIDACPSAALSYNMKNKETMDTKEEITVNIAENGPLLVHGKICVVDAAGNKEHKEKVTAFCRCGASTNKPYCDGAHSKNGFKG